jgi:glycosyltransferase involved in cell wall biosynthesis
MRIACANWSRRRAGGVESYLEFLLPGLAGLGHDVALWTERDEPIDRAPIALKGSIPSWCASGGLDGSLASLASWSPDVVFAHGLVDPAIERRLVNIAPSVLLAHSYYGTCISGGKTMMSPKAEPCGRVFGPACLALFYPRRCGGLNPLTMAREYRHQADRLAVVRTYRAVLTLSEHMRQEYLQHGLDERSVHCLPPFVPQVDIAPKSHEPRGSRELTLLFVGRLDRLKGCDVLIEALRRVAFIAERPVRLTVAGDGPHRETCEDTARHVSSNRVRVDFRGWIDGAERARLLSTADVVVMPSLWPEPYGLAGLEAVAAGVPVAAFASGGVTEWLHEGIEGALAPAAPPQPSGLADAIVRAARLGRREPVSSEIRRAGQHVHLEAVAGHLAAATQVDAAARH